MRKLKGTYNIQTAMSGKFEVNEDCCEFTLPDKSKVYMDKPGTHVIEHDGFEIRFTYKQGLDGRKIVSITGNVLNRGYTEFRLEVERNGTCFMSGGISGRAYEAVETKKEDSNASDSPDNAP